MAERLITFYVFLKDVKESNLISWSGNKIEKQGDIESRNEFDVNNRVCIEMLPDSRARACICGFE